MILMLSINECTKVLNKSNKQYTDEEVILIRDFLYQLATLEISMINVNEEHE